MLHGLKTGSEVLKQINQEMNLEDVEKLLEETQEARAYQEVGQHPPNTPVTQSFPQEISNMLANNLTLEDEEAVQEQFKELQVVTPAVSPPTDHRGGVLIDTYSGSQDWTKGRYQAPGRFRHATRPCQDYRHRIVLSLCMRGPWLTTHPRFPSGGTNSGTGARSHIRPRNIYTRISFLSCNTEHIPRFRTTRSPPTQRRS